MSDRLVSLRRHGDLHRPPVISHANVPLAHDLEHRFVIVPPDVVENQPAFPLAGPIGACVAVAIVDALPEPMPAPVSIVTDSLEVR